VARPRSSAVLAAAAVAVSLALTACGSSSDGASNPPTSTADTTADTTPSTTEATTPTTTGPPAAGGSGVEVSGFRFQPDDVEVEVGEEVTWTNEDQVTHTATAVDGSFDVTMEGPDTTGAHTFTEPGTYEYLCAVHESMNGTIVVTDGEAGTTTP
jgi:plastocyanin